MRMLVAFEATARLGGIIRAAQELNISASSVSRHVRNLEIEVDKKLFKVQGRNLVLTEEGREYCSITTAALEKIHFAGQKIRSKPTSVIIACSQEISTEIVFPIFFDLKKYAGGHTAIRIVNSDDDMLPLLMPMGIDITLNYLNYCTVSHSERILAEAIMPISSPAFLEKYGDVLSKHPKYWAGLLRLELETKSEHGATWNTWFDAFECESPAGPVERFQNYHHLLEFAAKGAGIALVWKPSLHWLLQTKQLVRIGDKSIQTGKSLYALMTEYGLQNPHAERCVSALNELCRK